MKASELIAKLEEGYILIRYPLDYDAMDDYEREHNKESGIILDISRPMEFWLVPAKDYNGRKIQEWYEVIGFGYYGWKAKECFSDLCLNPHQWFSKEEKSIHFKDK